MTLLCSYCMLLLSYKLAVVYTIYKIVLVHRNGHGTGLFSGKPLGNTQVYKVKGYPQSTSGYK